MNRIILEMDAAILVMLSEQLGTGVHMIAYLDKLEI
jgi:hypothetical protein